MKKKLLLVAIIYVVLLFGTFVFASQSTYKLVTYRPLSQSECQWYKEQLGLQYCPYDNDHLAGAALACGHIDRLPTKEQLHMLAKQVYNTDTTDTTIYGNRNDDMLKDMGIFVNDSHIYYWIGEEAKDGNGGYVRMFASKGSIPYYAPRNGKGYVSKALGMVNYGTTKNIITKNPEHNSNLVGLPNKDALVCICSLNNRIRVKQNKYNLDVFGKILHLN